MYTRILSTLYVQLDTLIDLSPSFVTDYYFPPSWLGEENNVIMICDAFLTIFAKTPIYLHSTFLPDCFNSNYILVQ